MADAKPTSIHLPQYVRDLLADIAKNEGFEHFDESCVDLNSGSSQDDGFFGNLVAVTISDKKTGECNGDTGDTSEQPTSLHLLCKLIPSNEDTRVEMNMDAIFARETFFYQNVLPEFEKFQLSKGLNAKNGFFGFPKCYACVCDESKDQFVIVMEDMRARNYGMWPKKQPVDLDHVKSVLREMAKFHAVSLALNDQHPDVFKKLKTVYDLFRSLMKRQTFINYFNGSHERAVNILEEQLPEYAPKFRSIWENAVPLLDKVLDGNDFEPYSVLVHADCWNNNILFKYDQTEPNKRTPDKVCFVDWQFSNYNSPALDLLYYIFTATDKPLREQHYTQLIQLYHSVLSETIELLGSSADQLFPFRVLTDHLNIFGPYTYLVIPITIDVALADPGDIIHFDELITTNATDGDGKKVDFLNEFGEEATRKAYSTRIIDIAEDLIELGYVK